MGTSPKIRVMLSSRCNDFFSAEEKTSLTDIRRALKRGIEAETLFGAKPFKVWINEDSEALDHTEDSWNACLKQVRDCDVLIVLYNGNAGWDRPVCRMWPVRLCRSLWLAWTIGYGVFALLSLCVGIRHFRRD